MNNITVNYDNKPIYDIVYSDSFDKLSEELLKLGYKGKKICIVSETNVASLYLDAILISLDGIYSDIISYVFPEGEQSKNLDVVYGLYDELIKNKFSREDILIALGGGVVGDLTGFAAATYLRGIDFIQVPTSLLSQVDSSIGGKTGVDFKSYKNMVGAFHMPKLVYMNLSVLNTLNRRQFNSGMAEIIKHGIIKNPEYFNWLQDNSQSIINKDFDTLYHMIYESCMVKKAVVENDPKEKGERALLNFGHTLGHAIEKYMDFSFLHGECVFIGMLLSAIISQKRGLIDSFSLDKIIDAISAWNVPHIPEDLDIEKVISYTKNDKKASQGTIKFILINKIGEAFIDLTVTEQEMADSIITLRNYYNEGKI